MKILYIANSYPPYISGTSIIAKNVANWMSKKHKISIIRPSNSLKPETYHENNITHFLLPSSRAPAIRKNYRFMLPNNLKIKKIFQEFQPDILHFYEPSAPSLYAKRLAVKKSIPTLVSHFFIPQMLFEYLPIKPLIINKTDPKNQATTITLKAILKLYKDCSAIISLTQTIKELLKPHTSISIHVISAGIDYKNYATVPSSTVRAIFAKYNLPKKPTLLHVGRLDQEKNIETLIHAWSQIAKKHTTLNLTICGDGTQREKLETLANNQGLTDSITWVGMVPEHDLPPIYNNPYTRAFIIPSAIETQSIVTLQALAAGLPVIAANAGALPEIVIPKKTGYLCNPHSPSQYVSAVTQLLSDSSVVPLYSKNAKILAKKHDKLISKKKYFNLYETLKY